MTQATQTPYDCTEDVRDHINLVRRYLDVVRAQLSLRGIEHDRSKLATPEKEAFDEITPLLRTVEYGTPEYKETFKGVKVAMDHHYRVNRHHPEHFADGIDGMNLLDVVEMVCDWMAAADRKSGDVHLETNVNRFEISSQLAHIISNTITALRVGVVANVPDPALPVNEYESGPELAKGTVSNG